VEWFRRFEGDIFSSEAVLTEVLYLLNSSAKAQLAAFDFVLNGAITIVASDLESLRKAKKLMAKYSDVPMDYADATLVCLADDLSIPHVVTFDVRGFGIYRLSLKRPFIILP
jgi:predicted nucleic acid-binding protein